MPADVDEPGQAALRLVRRHPPQLATAAAHDDIAMTFRVVGYDITRNDVAVIRQNSKVHLNLRSIGSRYKPAPLATLRVVPRQVSRLLQHDSDFVVSIVSKQQTERKIELCNRHGDEIDERIFIPDVEMN